ncbi:MAG TPA: nicotinamide riboside transporter PnuC [Chitinophagaceae bacterium]|jgi:nicotinamide mononucleotide transporter
MKEIRERNLQSLGEFSEQLKLYCYLRVMSIHEIWQQFVEGMRETNWIEYLAVFSGIASVWFSRLENILVYPVGLINTIIYIGISVNGHLLGEASVNFYYTVVSIYGWILWAKRDKQNHHVLIITKSSSKEWIQHILFFAAFYIVIFASLTYLKAKFTPGAIPWADAFASGTAYTGMWLMAKKKVESWYWWIATNIASIPLYFVKHYVFTSVYYLVLLVMAVFGLLEWIDRARKERVMAPGHHP